MAEEPKESKEQKKEEKKGSEQKDQRQQRDKSVESIVRIAGRDINGKYRIESGLLQIKGIGHNLSHALTIAADRIYGIKPEMTFGSLNDEQLGKLETLLKDPLKAGIPAYMANHRRDLETNTDMHLVGTDLTVKTRQDIDFDIRIQTWRGFRHQYRQRVRGQRTRSTGRTGATVGVIKKSAAAPGKAEEGAAAAQTASTGTGSAKTGPSAAPKGPAPAAGATPAAGPAPKADARPEAKPAEKKPEQK